MATDRWIRASDQDRQSAVELLSEGYAVGRLRREELDERATLAYSATAWGELRDLTADLPLPLARAGPLPQSVASRHAPPRASQRLVSLLIWMFFMLVLVAGVAGLVPPVDMWVAAIPIPIALLLTPPPGIRGQRNAASCVSGWAVACLPRSIGVPGRADLGHAGLLPSNSAEQHGKTAVQVRRGDSPGG